jgi:hypothetical protein
LCRLPCVHVGNPGVEERKKLALRFVVTVQIPFNRQVECTVKDPRSCAKVPFARIFAKFPCFSAPNAHHSKARSVQNHPKMCPCHLKKIQQSDSKFPLLELSRCANTRISLPQEAHGFSWPLHDTQKLNSAARNFDREGCEFKL